MASGEKFSIGRVFSRMFQSILERWSSVGAFALITGLISAAIGSFTSYQVLTGMNFADPNQALTLFSSPTYYLSAVLGMVVYGFTLAGSLYGFLAPDDENLSIGACFSAAARLFLPMLGLSILYFLAFGIGWVLFLVPGLIIATMFSVSSGARVAEPIGVFEAFGRSRALTSGLRWPIFGCLLLFIIIYFLIAFVAQSAGLIGITAVAQFNPVLLIAISSIVSLVLNLLLNSFLAALYRETVLVKEGGDTRDLAQIFA
jgi:hypothetical protein